MMTASGEATYGCKGKGGSSLHCTLKGLCVQMIAEENVYQLA